jgi:phosphoadenosine phosphosulfate reductase
MKDFMSTPAVLSEEINQANDDLKERSPQEVLRWAVSRYHPRLTMATAFGAEGCCLIHMLAEIEPGVRIFNLETGYQFPETLEMKDRIKSRYGIDVELIKPDLTVPEYEEKHHGPLYVRQPDQCCFDRKTIPLRRAVAGYEAWISAIRRDQTSHRAKADIVQWDSKFNLVKVNPLLSWTKREVWSFILEHEIPYNPLHDRGYASIGCWPCTRAVADSEDERAGRWSGTDKKECGLHVMEQEGGSGI